MVRERTSLDLGRGVVRIGEDRVAVIAPLGVGEVLVSTAHDGDGVERYVVISRNPEPGEVGVVNESLCGVTLDALDDVIAIFEIVDPDGLWFLLKTLDRAIESVREEKRRELAKRQAIARHLGEVAR